MTTPAPTYTGGMAAWGSIAAWQAAAEKANANPEVAECGHTVDENGQIVLEGENGMAGGFGGHAGDAVPITVQHVQTPVVKRSLPASLPTSPLGKGGK